MTEISGERSEVNKGTVLCTMLCALSFFSPLHFAFPRITPILPAWSRSENIKWVKICRTKF